ncbi:putative holin-like toxin [Halobacillus amylolyticus]|uniref:Holin-like toxin n=1 Tax=Halobacillus amylolyticus TaxID=2932259 RepID=A0ABY4H824_9BACI|nr:putative holin-like toxin [Halobacillus amylolyticus]UOR11020.1 putative holin-like toxin [Halobacillus amylolyticus]
MSMYEVLMVLFTFGTFLIALLALIIKMINKK